ncbi:MAG: RNA-binding S4 domain-containing protein [Verrucomicrobia bacterium]|nr:RNA-binding S4 domain-containing protein [Verrucomicrobiota bacterium]
MEAPPSVRVDKWLWAVRLFKTRPLAADACLAGKVKIAGLPVKPARNVHVGEILTAVAGEITRTVKVVALLDKRVGAKLVADFMADLTPAAELHKPREPNFQAPFQRAKGSGRPTKKERRSFEEYFGG